MFGNSLHLKNITLNLIADLGFWIREPVFLKKMEIATSVTMRKEKWMMTKEKKILGRINLSIHLISVFSKFER